MHKNINNILKHMIYKKQKRPFQGVFYIYNKTYYSLLCHWQESNLYWENPTAT